MHVRGTWLLAGLLGVSVVSADAPPRFEAKREQQADYRSTASDAYGVGYALIERATRFEHDAAAARDTRAKETALRAAAQAYEDALQAFEAAVASEPEMYEALTYIGYACRKLQRFDQALSAYEAALRLKPDYPQAIEYQGETYLELDRFEDAKRNYLRLYALDGSQANKLLAAMHHWSRARQHDQHGANSEELAAAISWLEAHPSAKNMSATSGTPW